MYRVGNLLACAVVVLAIFAPPLHAVKQYTPALDDLVDRSDAIIVATVRSIDESASTDPSAPLTSVEFDVVRVLRGTLPSSKTFTMTFRGGVTPDGMRQQWTSVPSLAVENEYVLFLRAEYYVSPLIPGPNSLMRSVGAHGRKIAVDGEGRVIRASARHGLLRGGKVSDSVSQRHERGEPKRQLGRQADKAALERGRMAAAAGSDFDEVLELISSASSRAERVAKPISATLRPLPLPGDTPSAD